MSEFIDSEEPDDPEEDAMLYKMAEEAYKRWEEGGKKTIPHEELWKRLDLDDK